MTLGLLGMGEIAREVMLLARAFGLKLQYHRRNRLPAAEEAELGITYCGRDELFASSDILSIHVPLEAATRGLVGADALDKIKPGAWLINTSRADIVDHDCAGRCAEVGPARRAGGRRALSGAGRRRTSRCSHSTTCC